ncbi:MAG: D-alanine--D-alanine ligase [Phycisphaeraceae bacterium]|nr:MAG: D-alanine--D-alanine ligase [Phycisphaeraceae bacterium]
MTTVVRVLAGGPDAERAVSIDSGRAIAEALGASGRFAPELSIIDRIDQGELAELTGEIVFPALHGPYGEGGPLQRLLEADGRPFVGSGSRAAKRAIDKVVTKSIAAHEGIPVLSTAILDPEDDGLPFALPIVVKPIFEGSTIGLHVCREQHEWLATHRAAQVSRKPTMIEPFVEGRELTVGMIDRGSGLECVPIIEIIPKHKLYDYEAKYAREDTQYVLDPDLPEGVAEIVTESTAKLAHALGIRDVCRADFMLDEVGRPFLLEINTMPGFTSHSLVPKACAHIGISMSDLCAHLVERAMARATTLEMHE